MSSRWLLYVPGNPWDDVAGTDHQLARALSERGPVLWVDPPWSAARLRPGRSPDRRVREVADGIHRLQFVGPPFGSRAGVRRLAAEWARTKITRHVRLTRLELRGCVVTSPQALLPRVEGPRVLFVTDDWVSGAPMMGLSARAVERVVVDNLSNADAAAAVSPDLALRVGQWSAGRLEVEVLPNGVSPQGVIAHTGDRPTAGVVGQLNERLDIDLLEAVLDAGVDLRIVGPVTARDPRSMSRIAALLQRPHVMATGRVPASALSAEFSKIDVGLTPYLDNEFNRASFPLKTLEYLGAGLPVVASDLPSTRWLQCPYVDIASDAASFGQLTRQRAQQGHHEAVAEQRVRFAEQHSWSARADQLTALLDRAAASRG